MRKIACGSLALAFCVVSAGPARAGVVDSPLPVGFAKHAYSVPGIINLSGLATFFACTNADTSAVTVGIEIFGPAGGAALNTASATAISMAPGATVMFATAPAAGISVDANLAPGLVSKGSARIITNGSAKILCTASIADTAGSPPAAGWLLTVVKGVKQKAFN